jgi:hypothetical protein
MLGTSAFNKFHSKMFSKLKILYQLQWVYIMAYNRGRRSGINYPKWGKNKILGGNEDSVETAKKDFPL